MRGRILSGSPPDRCQKHISLLVINEKFSWHCQIVPRGHIAFSCKPFFLDQSEFGHSVTRGSFDLYLSSLESTC